jgi:hypothetical protein
MAAIQISESWDARGILRLALGDCNSQKLLTAEIAEKYQRSQRRTNTNGNNPVDIIGEVFSAHSGISQRSLRLKALF